MDWGSFVQYGLGRWLHIGSGVMWVGMLYYFNFVQVAALKAAAADGTAPGITKHVAPRRLPGFAHQHHVVDSHAVFHGGIARHIPSRDVLLLVPGYTARNTAAGFRPAAVFIWQESASKRAACELHQAWQPAKPAAVSAASLMPCLPESINSRCASMR